MRNSSPQSIHNIQCGQRKKYGGREKKKDGGQRKKDKKLVHQTRKGSRGAEALTGKQLEIAKTFHLSKEV